MPARKAKGSCYVYRLFDGHETVYIGKGSGRRLALQRARFRCDGEVLRAGLTDDEAFAVEREMIALLRPTANVSPGGNGGRHRPKELSAAERRAAREWAAFEKEFAAAPRRYVARFLVRKLAEHNCERFGVSLQSMATIKAVANGPAV